MPHTLRAPTRRLPAPIASAAALYVALTVALTWPLALHPGSLVPSDLGDPLLNMWLMAWNARTVPLTAAWWNAPQFFPAEGATAFSEHLLGLSIITTPIVAATGNAVLAHNVAFLLAFPLCALAAYFLTFTIVRRHDAALVAGLAFGFAPYRMAQFAHVQVLSAYWMPLALAGLHRYLDGRRLRWLALFAVSWTMQALVCGYYLFYLSVLIGLWLLWFAHGREHRRSLAPIAAAWAVAAAMLVPVVLGYWKFQHHYGMRRGIDEIRAFSADIASVLKAPETLRLWGWLNVIDRPESALFPGLAIVLLVAAGLWQHARTAPPPSPRGIRRLRTALVGAALVAAAVALVPAIAGPRVLRIGGVRLLSVSTAVKPFSVAALLMLCVLCTSPRIRAAWQRRSPLAFYALATVAMWLLSLGPAPTLMNTPALYKAPYAWLMLLPGLDGVRVPARFWMLGALCLAVAAGLALRHLAARWPRAGAALPAIACLLIVADAWPRPLRVWTPPAPRPSHGEAVARLDLPPGLSRDIAALFRSIEHRRPMINGYSGYAPQHYWSLGYLIEARNPAVLSRLAEYGAIEVTVDHREDESGEWRRFVESNPAAERIYSDADYTSYRIRGGDRPPLRGVRGADLPVAAITATINQQAAAAMIDGNLDTLWRTVRPQAPGDEVIVDLGQPRGVAGVEMLLGGYVADFPRRLSIETSLDGHLWTDAWSGDTALISFSAALDDPHVPMPFPLRPVSARYLRLTQTAESETGLHAAAWSIVELRVKGQ